MHTKTSPLRPDFVFAGFAWPRYLATLPTGPLDKRLEARKTSCTGLYYHCPTPNSKGARGFYLTDHDGMGFRLRWQWADEVEDVRIDHTGWFCADYDDGFGAKYRGMIFRLPRGRGFLAGYSMGAGMISALSPYVYDCPRTAAYSADGLAQRAAAEDEQAYQAEQREESEEREREREAREAREAQEKEDAEVKRLTLAAHDIRDIINTYGAAWSDDLAAILRRADIHIAD